MEKIYARPSVDIYKGSKLIQLYSTRDLISQYQEYFSLDVQQYFTGIETIELRESKSGYRFFFPFTVCGDGNFYKELQKIEWYYQEWKWEYGICEAIIKPSSSILEIGCGNGAFIRKLKNTNYCVGLELNENQIVDIERLKILNQTVEEHANSNIGVYDWVISFQVLEHIADINSFMAASLAVLKANGRMIIAVPNNNAFFFSGIDFQISDNEYKKTLLLNFPPHHMGHWTSRSLTRLAHDFGLSVQRKIPQPIQPWRRHLNNRLLITQLSNAVNDTFKNSILSVLRIFNRRLKGRNVGDTVMVVLERR